MRLPKKKSGGSEKLKINHEEYKTTLALFTLSWRTLLFIIICVGLDQLGRFMCLRLDAPAWGDFAGTALAAIVCGPIGGLITGVLSNLFNVVTSGSWWPDTVYSIVGAVGGVTIGMTFPREKKRIDPFTVSLSGFYVTIATVATSVPLNLIFYQGYTGNT